MSDITLDRLNPQSFERLIRALAFEIFGPSGVVYSPGPDGARDFSVEGRIKGYESKGWNGRLVVQAKFREKLHGDDSDLKWLHKHLKAEEKKLQEIDDKRKPDYYIVVTNVPLSGADGKGRGGKARTGGYTKTQTLLTEWKETIGLSDFDIWPADKIEDLLQSHPQIRQSYSAWVTSSDVLNAALTNFAASKNDFSAIIKRALKGGLKRDYLARLRDAGSVSEPSIRTSQVFIDLPVKTSPFSHFSDPMDEGQFEPSHHQSRSGNGSLLVERLVSLSRARLDPSGVEEIKADVGRTDKGEVNKVVILGGPGQGKSTGSMFLAQIYRANLVRDSSDQADGTVSGLVTEILARARDQGIVDALPLRYPIHISLPRYADSISRARKMSEKLPSLLTFIAEEISDLGDAEVTKDDVRRWLATYPWIVVLDGLDEVPPSGERKATVSAISAFETEVFEANADVLLVVTTRPQGYDSDLDPERWQHWRLTNLSRDRALDYAAALSHARYPEDGRRRNDIQAAIRDAMTSGATVRLMVNPLQVTILHLIVDTGGAVPPARWTLFNEYFDVLRKRERAKGGEIGNVISRNWSYLGPIHQRAGLLLHIMGERSGGASSPLDHERFRTLLHNYLHSEGFEEPLLGERVSELMSVALQRLVLLSTKQEETIGFDVRSLQEFMAAAALTSGDSDPMERRLSRIAGAVHWRHVFLIAASRCFADDTFHQRRSIVLQLARALDAQPVDSYVRSGAQLALDMFEDGVGYDYPIARKSLAIHALELLELGEVNFDHRLVLLNEPMTESILYERLAAKLRELPSIEAIAAWRLVAELSTKDERYMQLAEACWPADISAVPGLITFFAGMKLPESFETKARTSLFRVDPRSFVVDRRTTRLSPRQTANNAVAFSGRLAFLNAITDASSERGGVCEVSVLKSSEFHLRFMSLFRNRHWPELGTVEGSRWRYLERVRDFVQNPDKEALAVAFEATACSAERTALLRFFPWPLSGTLASIDPSEEGEVQRVAMLIRDGHFGNEDDWAAAEDRWMKNGLLESDFRMSSSGCTFAHDVAKRGYPVMVGMLVTSGDEDHLQLGRQLASFVPKASPRHKNALLRMACFALVGNGGGSKFSFSSGVEDFLCAFESIDGQHSDAGDFLGRIDDQVWENEEYADRLSDIAARQTLKATVDSMQEANLLLMCRVFGEKPERRRGLLKLIAALALQDEANIEDILACLPPSAFRSIDTDDSDMKLAVQLMKIIGGDHSVIMNVPNEQLSEDQTVEVYRVMFEALDISRDPELLIGEVLIPFFQSRGDQLSRLANSVLTVQVRRLLDRRGSGYSNKKFWSSDELPMDAYEVMPEENSDMIEGAR